MEQTVQQFKMKDKKTIIIIILSIILIVIAGVFVYNQIENKSYNQGVQDTILIINQQILNSLQQNGYVPFIYLDNNNQTVQIKLVPYEE